MRLQDRPVKVVSKISCLRGSHMFPCIFVDSWRRDFRPEPKAKGSSAEQGMKALHRDWCRPGQVLLSYPAPGSNALQSTIIWVLYRSDGPWSYEYIY